MQAPDSPSCITSGSVSVPGTSIDTVPDLHKVLPTNPIRKVWPQLVLGTVPVLPSEDTLSYTCTSYCHPIPVSDTPSCTSTRYSLLYLHKIIPPVSAPYTTSCTCTGYYLRYSGTLVPLPSILTHDFPNSWNVLVDHN
jgi:hypothetical protein